MGSTQAAGDRVGRQNDGHLHVALNKPLEFSCSHSRAESPIIDELLPQALRGARLQTVGRLDRDTSGLLVLTTDGGLIHRLAQPESKIEKEYRVGYRGLLPADAVARCERGLEIEGYAKPTLPAQLSIERHARFQTAIAEEQLGEATLILREGRHHQVRRMFRALGAKVVTLHRERLGHYQLPSELAPGQFVEIDAMELDTPIGHSSRAERRSL
jgi:16S rRNA pseudouridine516 synthase